MKRAGVYAILAALGFLGGYLWGYRGGEIDGYNRGYLDGQNSVVCAEVPK